MKDGHYGFGELVLVHDLLLVQTETGPVALVEANPAEFREGGAGSRTGFQNVEQSRGGRGLPAGAQRQGSDLLQTGHAVSRRKAGGRNRTVIFNQRFGIKAFTRSRKRRLFCRGV